MERNKYLEKGGLYWESDTHEWFQDRSSTEYAHMPNANGITLKNIVAFVVRNKATGEYDRILMDNKSNQIIYETKMLENIGFHIDQLKIIKLYEKE